MLTLIKKMSVKNVQSYTYYIYVFRHAETILEKIYVWISNILVRQIYPLPSRSSKYFKTKF